MKPFRTKVAAIAASTVALALSSAALSATPAQASGGCPVNPFYSLTSSSIRIPFKGLPIFKDGPGGTLSVTKDFSSSASYQVTAGASAEVSGVFASAKVEVSASLTKTNSSTVTNNYTHTITRGKYGHAQYVAYGKKVNYKKQIFNSACKIITLATGSINFPTNTEGWYYWETSS